MSLVEFELLLDLNFLGEQFYLIEIPLVFPPCPTFAASFTAERDKQDIHSIPFPYIITSHQLSERSLRLLTIINTLSNIYQFNGDTLMVILLSPLCIITKIMVSPFIFVYCSIFYFYFLPSTPSLLPFYLPFSPSIAITAIGLTVEVLIIPLIAIIIISTLRFLSLMLPIMCSLLRRKHFAKRKIVRQILFLLDYLPFLG